MLYRRWSPTTVVGRCGPSGPAECVGLVSVRRSVPDTCRYRSAYRQAGCRLRVPHRYGGPARCGAVLPVTARPGMGWWATIAGKARASNHVYTGEAAFPRGGNAVALQGVETREQDATCEC